MAFEITSALVGAAAGWAGQWFLIDRPVYRKLDQGGAQTLAGGAVGLDLQSKIDALNLKLNEEVSARAKITGEFEACRAARTALETELAQLKADHAEVLETLNLTKKELGQVRPATNQKDDLELIDGIGPVFERKLYDAGVLTFRQLSETPIDKIREIINPQKWQKIEPEKWVVEAKDFADKGVS